MTPRLPDCLGWKNGGTVDHDRLERTLGQTTSRTKPDEFGFRRVKLESVVRHPLIQTPILPMQSTSLDGKWCMSSTTQWS